MFFNNITKTLFSFKRQKINLIKEFHKNNLWQKDITELSEKFHGDSLWAKENL